MVFRRIIGNADDPIVTVERFKLMASGCQLVAIGVLVASIVAPFFNPTLHPDLWTRLAGGGAAALIELLALRIMGHISIPSAKKED